MTVDELVAEQLAMNERTWSALQDAGVTEGSTLSLDFFFLPGDEPGARALEASLSAEASEIHLTASKVGVVKRRQVWSVSGTTKPLRMSLPALNEWVVHIVRIGAEHGLRFDGWGAEAPGPDR